MVWLALSGADVPTAALAQGPNATRRTTTVDALVRYPIFFHGQRVVVWGRLVGDDRETWLVYGNQRVLVWGPDVEGAAGDGPTVEVRGTFFDAGRLEPDDGRFTTNRLDELSRTHLGRDHPGVGDLLVLVVTEHMPAPTPPAPSIRSIALDPDRYEGQTVTVVGRFRGHNLYGDLPGVPGLGRWEFVLQSADAAVWVTGLRPRGRGFNLDIDARVDTGEWLEATGLVTSNRGLIWLVARQLSKAEPPPPEQVVPPAPPPQPAIVPVVLFSAPTDDEIDVPVTTRVRIQFSRDMAAQSFGGRVRAGYVGDAADSPPINMATAYDAGRRVLEIAFRESLVPLRQVQVQLGEGIATTDGAPLEPWTLTFTLGADSP